MTNRALTCTVFEPEAREAFGELVERYQNAAIAYAYAILRNHAVAEDAAQAAFLTAWLRRADLREPRAFGSWLRTIALQEKDPRGAAEAIARFLARQPMRVPA